MPLSRSSQRTLHLDINTLRHEDESSSVTASTSSSSGSSVSFNTCASVAGSLMSDLSSLVICSVLCLHDFQSDDPDQLGFCKNEILEVVQQENNGWWAAMRLADPRVGWIPKSFVQPLSDSMADKLRHVREELRVYEYEAEALYLAAPIAALSQLDDSDTSTEDNGGWDSPASKVPSLRLLIPADLVPSGDVDSDPLPRREYKTSLTIQVETRKSKPLPFPPTPSPSTPIPQPSEINGLRVAVDKPTPPTPFSAAGERELPQDVASEKSQSPDSLNRNNRRRPIVIDNTHALHQLHGIIESPSPPTVDFSLGPEKSGSLETFDEVVANIRTGRVKAATIDVVPPTKSGSLDTFDDVVVNLHIERLKANSMDEVAPRFPHSSSNSNRDDVVFGPNGAIRAASLRALVERLTAGPLNVREDKPFRDVFLTTFRTFTTPDELFDLLVEMYGVNPPAGLAGAELEDWREKRVTVAQNRVLTLFTMWLEDHRLLDEEPHIAGRLTTFLTQITTPTSLALTAKLMLQDLERLTFAMPAPDSGNSQRRPRKSKPHKNDLLRLDPADISEQLCLLEHRIYRKIRPQECINWVKVKAGPTVANLQAYCATHDKLASWVKASILNTELLGRRADTVDFWIKVTEKCRSLQNFSSMSALLSALTSIAISRLHLTWAHAGRRSQLEVLEKYNEPTGGFSGYRTLQQGAEGPCLPFIGMHLTDLVHNNDQIPDSVSSPSNQDVMLISFAKRQRLYDIISTVLRHQTRAYAFAENEATRNFIDSHLQAASGLSCDWFWEKSQEVQQSELAQSDIRKGIEAAGF